MRHQFSSHIRWCFREFYQVYLLFTCKNSVLNQLILLQLLFSLNIIISFCPLTLAFFFTYLYLVHFLSNVRTSKINPNDFFSVEIIYHSEFSWICSVLVTLVFHVPQLSFLYFKNHESESCLYRWSLHLDWINLTVKNVL